MKTIKTTLLVLLFVFIAGYTVFNTKLIIRGVNLVVLGIENGESYKKGSLDITGNANKARHLLVNGRELNITQEGDFSDTLVLLPGYNIITVSAEDRFGKITKKTFEVIRAQD